MTTRSLVATFSDYSAAQQAARELESLGVPADQVTIDSNRKTAGAGSGGVAPPEHQHSGFSAWWHSLFGSDDNDERNEYEGAIASGGTILRAEVPERLVHHASDVLNRSGAVDDWSRPDSSTTAEMYRDGADRPMAVIDEELQLGKRSVRRGGVRIYSHVVNQPVEEQIRLREEHITVQRRPVNREASTEQLSAFRDQTIEVPEMAEEPVVTKRAKVREEIIVEKETSERNETIRDTVRHTEVEVEQMGRESHSGAGSDPSGHREPVRATGLSPNPPSPGVLSGFGSTAGAGTLAGQTTAGSGARELHRDDFTPEYRQNFEQTYGTSEGFESMRPAYEYGYRSAGDSRYKGRAWDDVENDLRDDYQRTSSGSKWEDTKHAVRYGWEKMTGRG